MLNVDLIGTVRGDTYFKCIDWNLHVFHRHWKYKDHIANSVSKLNWLQSINVKNIKIRVLHHPEKKDLVLVISLDKFLEKGVPIKFEKKNCDNQLGIHYKWFKESSIHQEIF